MNETLATILTPMGTGAIAAVALVGPRAWEIVRTRFQPAGTKPLPDAPQLHRVWFGKVGGDVGDEVVLAVRAVEPQPSLELHCHGGRQVVRWLLKELTAAGCREQAWTDALDQLSGHLSQLPSAPHPVVPLTQAPTLRTASILLDQYQGAFARAVATALEQPEETGSILASLAAFAPLGRHLTTPWKVVIAGPPNVGKSSLVNALAGYQRSVVAPVAGTTRDVVTTALAFEGWPVELSDTAGLRDAAEALEAEGIARAKVSLQAADLIVWLIDRSDPAPELPPDSLRQQVLLVENKADLPPVARSRTFTQGEAPLAVSALTGAGIQELAAAIVRRLVPVAPSPGSAVPYTPALADAVMRAASSWQAGQQEQAREVLRREAR